MLTDESCLELSSFGAESTPASPWFLTHSVHVLSGLVFSSRSGLNLIMQHSADLAPSAVLISVVEH